MYGFNKRTGLNYVGSFIPSQKQTEHFRRQYRIRDNGKLCTCRRDLHGEPFAQCQNFFATGKAYEHFISNCNFNLMIMNVEIKKRELCFSIFPPLL